MRNLHQGLLPHVTSVKIIPLRSDNDPWEYPKHDIEATNDIRRCYPRRMWLLVCGHVNPKSLLYLLFLSMEQTFWRKHAFQARTHWPMWNKRELGNIIDLFPIHLVFTGNQGTVYSNKHPPILPVTHSWPTRSIDRWHGRPIQPIAKHTQVILVCILDHTADGGYWQALICRQ